MGARLKPTSAVEHLARMGQDLLRPPTVEGWKAGRTWISPSLWIARERCCSELAGRWLKDAPAANFTGDLDTVLQALMPGQDEPSWAASLRREAPEDKAADARLEWLTLLLACPEVHLS